MLRPTIYLPTPLLERLRRTDATRAAARPGDEPVRPKPDRTGPAVEPAERGAACSAVA
jgi:hypothetical protein